MARQRLPGRVLLACLLLAGSVCCARARAPSVHAASAPGPDAAAAAAHAHAPPRLPPYELPDGAARRLFDLLGAEEPLEAADVARLLDQLRSACAPGGRGAGAAGETHSLGVADVLRAFGRGGVLSEGDAERACTAIMACQVGVRARAAGVSVLASAQGRAPCGAAGPCH